MSFATGIALIMGSFAFLGGASPRIVGFHVRAEALGDARVHRSVRARSVCPGFAAQAGERCASAMRCVVCIAVTYPTKQAGLDEALQRSKRVLVSYRDPESADG